ncbi:MAG: alpha/beta hydrolase [Sphaerochaetaceae bacterium]|nr:alpha/beta hydrolase [Sphaerochaetaceae bacterium]
MLLLIKMVGIVVILVLAVVLVVFAGSFINHRLQLKKETEAFPPPGILIPVDGVTLHLYVQGNSDTTLVFLAGHGTSCPTLDFKPLWSQLVDAFTIVVVERTGYGWSPTSKSPRDIDTVLEQSRTALQLAGHTAPYVLIPHSMSGLEAIHWAQKYPDEVQAIIGLDPSTPKALRTLPEAQKSQLTALQVLSLIGITRFIPKSDIQSYLPLLASKSLSDAEKANYRAMFYRSTVTSDMIREAEVVGENSKIVDQFGVPVETPMHFFLSEEQDHIAPGWIEVATTYLSSVSKSSYTILAVDHYVHHEEADLIASEILDFLKQL